MIAKIVNNHCDARDIRVPGAKVIKLPAYGSIEINLRIDDVGALEVELRKRAPAATIVIEPLPVVETQATEAVPEGDDRASDSAAEDIRLTPIPESPKPIGGVVVPEKRKRRSKK